MTMADGRVEVGVAAISTQIRDNATPNGISTATIDLTIISEALESCKKKSKAQNIDNVSEIRMSDQGWSQAHTSEVSDREAKDEGVIKEVTFGGKPALQKGKQSSVFGDKSSSSYSQTAVTDIYSEMIDFKKFVFLEMANLRTST